MATSRPTEVTVAAVQTTPVYLDRDATVDHLTDTIKEAATAGAQLIVFPEAIVPGYPDWVWRLPAWSDGDWYQRLHDQAVEIPDPPPNGWAPPPERRAHGWRLGSPNAWRRARSTTPCCTSTPPAPSRGYIAS